MVRPYQTVSDRTLTNQSSKGFQQGDPHVVREDLLIVDLYSDDGGVEVMFLQKGYQNPTGVTQPEINRIVQSLHKTPQVG